MYVSNPAPEGYLYSRTFGDLPTKKQFMRAYRLQLGDERNPYEMLLRGEDLEAAEDTVFDIADYRTYFSSDEVWEGLKQLTKKWREDDDWKAGSLASSILETLKIEWV
jgi:hypothetical protein